MCEVGESAEEADEDDEDDDYGDCDDEDPGLLGSLELLELLELPGSVWAANNDPTRSELVTQKAMVRGNSLCFILIPLFLLFQSHMISDTAD